MKRKERSRNDKIMTRRKRNGHLVASVLMSDITFWTVDNYSTVRSHSPHVDYRTAVCSILQAPLQGRELPLPCHDRLSSDLQRAFLLCTNTPYLPCHIFFFFSAFQCHSFSVLILLAHFISFSTRGVSEKKQKTLQKRKQKATVPPQKRNARETKK